MSPYNAALMRYLEQTDPDDWHRIAFGLNWDNGVEPLAWIIRQPECDQATALLIYWHGGPRWSAQYSDRTAVPEWHAENYDLLKEIERRYTSGFYTRHEIAFDPRNDQGTDWTSEYADISVQDPIPEVLFQATTGRTITETYLEEGYPPAVIDEMEQTDG